MASYMFTLKKLGRNSKPRPLEEIDHWLCDAINEVPSDESFSLAYQSMLTVFFSALWNEGGSHIEKRHLDWIKKTYPDHGEFTNVVESLIEEYDFTAWRN